MISCSARNWPRQDDAAFSSFVNVNDADAAPSDESIVPVGYGPSEISFSGASSIVMVVQVAVILLGLRIHHAPRKVCRDVEEEKGRRARQKRGVATQMWYELEWTTETMKT
jgi:hypothetical protein